MKTIANGESFNLEYMVCPIVLRFRGRAFENASLAVATNDRTPRPLRAANRRIVAMPIVNAADVVTLLRIQTRLNKNGVAIYNPIDCTLYGLFRRLPRKAVISIVTRCLIDILRCRGIVRSPFVATHVGNNTLPTRVSVEVWLPNKSSLATSRFDARRSRL